ncbi:hypothetical protein EI94DRAFT_1825216 [Lactarius quietus]|nr:hypothetical protein EI94DRAFT_1825216 [Lactarius quietus]
MDHHNLIRNIFSRNTSPPIQSYPDDQSPSTQHFPQFQHVSPSQSIKDVAPSSPPTHVESLFSNLTGSGQSSVNPNLPLQGIAHPMTTTAAAVTASGPTSPASSITALSAPTNMTTSTNTPRMRTSQVTAGKVPFFLSSVPYPPPALLRPAHLNRFQPLLVPLVLLIALRPLQPNAPRSNVSDTSQQQQQRLSPPTGSSPTYPLVGPPQQQPEISSYYESELLSPQTTSSEAIQAAAPAQSQMQGSPQPNKTIGPVRKPAPPVSLQQQQGQSEPFEDTWTSVIDPKRKSVDNLLEHLSIPKAPALPSAHQIPFDQHSLDEETPIAEPVQSKAASRPLPPKPMQAPSPRPSPPKISPPARRDVQAPEPPLGPSLGPALSHIPTAQAQREKESSPGPVTQTGPISQPQMITVDVAQPLDDIQAPRDAVKSTAIALVRVDSNFLPGTTIGATHWVAYAMTKGRVRVISRSSGDRTLLQLPAVFAPTTSVTDMAVYGNRLAGVTSDGGFVVWELPDLITDDVPGKILLCVIPSVGQEALHSVKWHPKQQDTVAVASENDIYVLNISEASRMFDGEPIVQSDLHRIVQSIRMPAPLVAFEFDISHTAIATISSDSSLSLWSLRDRGRSFWSATIRGEDPPSSITFVDGGVVIGRKHGTIFQLLPNKSNNVLSTIKFVNGINNGFADDPDMFGHANYDSRIQTLWVANNRRDSMVAFKLGFDVSSPGRGNDMRPYIEQVLEFSGPKPTIHFVILTADADPRGEEAHAACVAAKVPPGELALVAFSVHSSGVDQVLIRKEWFDSALVTSPAKFPPAPHQSQIPVSEPRNQRQQLIQTPPVNIVQPVAQPMVPPPAPRIRTPPSAEEVDAEIREEGRSNDNRGRGRGKNVVMSKEIKKMEENLYSRIGRLVGKELDKQHQRLEDARVTEQAADITRQEKLLKLISNELTKNTTRNITKSEVKAVLVGQIAKGLGDSMNQAIPTEIERLLLRPDVSSHVARTFSSAITPIIERQSSSMHQELSREIHAEMLNIKKEVIAWQSEALRGQETMIRELEQSVRALSEQIKFLSINTAPPLQQSQVRGSPGPSAGPGGMVSFGQQQAFRHPAPPVNVTQMYGPPPPQQPPQPTMQGPWFPSGIPHLKHRIPPSPLLLNKRHRHPAGEVQPEVVMPLKGAPPLSQAVILTLVHRLAGAIGESAPVDESFKSSMWWLQRASTVLNTNDPLIAPYTSRVLPSVQAMLNTTKQRIAILPGGPQMLETARSISEVQDVLSHKPN